MSKFCFFLCSLFSYIQNTSGSWIPETVEPKLVQSDQSTLPTEKEKHFFFIYKKRLKKKCDNAQSFFRLFT